MRSQGKQKGQRWQKDGKMHFFHLFGASASHAAFHKNESSKNIALLILMTIPVSGEFRLKHRIRVRREAVAELAPVGVCGARDRLHLRRAEIVLGFDVRAV